MEKLNQDRIKVFCDQSDGKRQDEQDKRNKRLKRNDGTKHRSRL